MTTVFISHSTQNDAHADRLADALKDAGIDSWVDHRGGIEPGTPNWDREIRAAIRDQCEAGVLLMSPRSLKSDVCFAECALVCELGKPLYVAYLETAADVADIWLIVKAIQYAELRETFADGAQKLVRAIKGERGDDLPTATAVRITGVDTMYETLPYLNTTALVGRDDDLRAIRALLGVGQPVVQVTAVGGTGKSRLAAEVARSHPTGAIWHRIEPTSKPYMLLELVRQHCGLDKAADETALLEALARQPALVVIDNAEAVDTGEQDSYGRLCERLARRAPVLLTSRAVWTALKPKCKHPLVPIDGAQAARVALAFATAERVTLSDADAAALAEAARRHPRLIEFAVRLLGGGVLKLDDVVRRLRELKHDEVLDVLNAMIRQTAAQMRAQARHGEAAYALLCRLTVWRGAFDRAGAAALQPPDAGGEDALLDALGTLQAWAFVRADGERFRLDEVTRATLPPEDDAEAAQFAYIAALHGDHDANNDEDRHSLIAHDWLDVRAALDWGCREQPVAAADLATALSFYMSLRVARAEWREVLSQASAAVALLDAPRQQAPLLLRLGEVAYMEDEYGAARGYYERAQGVFEALGDRLGSANTLLGLGEVARLEGAYGAARGYYERAQGVFEALGSRLGSANTLLSLGDVAYMEDEYGAARGYYERAQGVFEALGDRLGSANTLLSLGDVARMEGAYGAARGYYERAQGVFEALGDFSGRLNCGVGLARLAAAQGEVAAACAAYAQVLALAASHPSYAAHPAVQGWRAEAARLGCDDDDEEQA